MFSKFSINLHYKYDILLKNEIMIKILVLHLPINSMNLDNNDKIDNCNHIIF
jgi:hypothetical protein